MDRRFADRAWLAALVRDGLGTDRRIEGLTRLRGGTKKGVYRLGLDDRSTVVAYVWSPDENYWPERRRPAGDDPSDTAGRADDPARDVFGDASGSELFEAADAILAAAGVRTPEVLLLDRSRSRYPADVALVEDVPGPNLEQRLAADPVRAAGTLARLAELLAAMRDCRGTRLGKVATLARPTDGTDRTADASTPVSGASASVSGASAPQPSAVEVVRDRALADLAEAARRDGRIAGDRVRLTELLSGLSAGIAPRTTYGLVHGELGPDHVLVDADSEPVLIDIEGLMFFDVEWEHVFLRLRFGEHYSPLAVDGLDERRLRFYQLAQHLSLVAGPLRLLDGDFPDRDFMRGIAARHAERVLAFRP
ncbi:phosphotransferase [Micromonospora sp. WMMD1102]|uniref:phosphotransferase n=1 Tax=Micromonospora sp. WMMD1102 TaxID=3016105 RepID=UPI002415863D|nr:phosphotransferase [Micromonospora sp. WMMD1102]MDG4790913.1 phosphotransferase [Micromonospora sp. WMMD1102]